MVLVTNSNQGLPTEARNILSRYFATGHAQPEDFEVFPRQALEAIHQGAIQEVLREKLCSTEVFMGVMSALRVVSNEAPEKMIVHRRVINEPLPLAKLREAECKGIHPDVISALVAGIDFTRSRGGYPLSKSADAKNHILCPVDQSAGEKFGVCLLTSVRSSRLGFTSPINFKKDQILPVGSVLLFTT